MSGGHFDHKQFWIREIADTIERDIAWALQPKPKKVHEDYWTIYEMDSFASSHIYPCYCKNFDSYEEAEAYLTQHEVVVRVESKYAERFFKDDTTFQSKVEFMKGTKDEERIPVLFAIHHCVYDHYPYDVDVLELEDMTLETMKEAYRQLRIAEIYAQRVDWMISGDDSEETLQKRLQEELQAFEKEFQAKDWNAVDMDDE
ncbi:hypothetical protein [uncultured Bacteroides sp.]|uniref:hypothetical protein n=1 Tax=uncultured Bacteroides sp. TaxID=162156 RepID=UPI0026700961|nr:hypothetical protein [uncultured Bacteroides sp.]